MFYFDIVLQISLTAGGLQLRDKCQTVFSPRKREGPNYSLLVSVADPDPNLFVGSGSNCPDPDPTIKSNKTRNKSNKLNRNLFFFKFTLKKIANKL